MTIIHSENTVEVGKTYEVNATDCCVSTRFTLKLVEIERDAPSEAFPEDAGSVNKLIFEHGVVVGWPFHGTTFTEVETT